MFSAYVSRKITLKMRKIKDEFLEFVHPPENPEEKKSFISKCKGIVKWISDKVS